jgi:hypothetical protein
VVNDLRGAVSGRLTVLDRAGSNRFKKALWRCRCFCGNERIVIGADLLTGHNTSCGCYRASGDARVTHGARRGGTSTRAYRAWENMKSRCDNPNLPQWSDYGGRGITYCDEWKSFEGFLRDMGEPPSGTTLDRIDNEQGYSRANCRWADRVTQRLNQRPYNARPTGRVYVLHSIESRQLVPKPPRIYRPSPRDGRSDLPAGGRSLKHGQRAGKLYHGKRPKGYAAWVNMRQRCTNPRSPDFKNYGQRGITYCREWDDFKTFLIDMGEPAPRMTLDRIDNEKNYERSNCRWISERSRISTSATASATLFTANLRHLPNGPARRGLGA